MKPSAGSDGVGSREARPATAEPEVATSQPGREIAQAGERRVLRIESLRAVAALGVLAAHVWGTAGGSFFEGFGSRVLSGLGFGALFFFALSGCLLYIPFARRDFGSGSPVSLRRYSLNRALRIFPLYYFALIVVLLLQEGGGTLEQWVSFTLFLENFSTETIATVNPALWTIVIELHFYILLPLIAWLIARLAGGSAKRALWVVGALLLASAAFRYFAVLEPNKVYGDPLRFSLPTTFYLLAAGMLVAVLREMWDRPPAWLRGPLASADVWLLAAIPPWLAFVYRYEYEPLFAISCFLILGAFVLPLRPSVVSGFLDWRPLAILGLASYSLYIWQVPVLREIGDAYIPIVDPLIFHAQRLIGSEFLGLLVVAVPLCAVIALISYRLVENPALRLRRRWGGFDRRRQGIRSAPGEARSGQPAAAGQGARS